MKKPEDKHSEEEAFEVMPEETENDPGKLQFVITELTNQLAEEMKKADEEKTKAAVYLDNLQRAQAEFANYKKQQSRLLEQREQGMRADILKKYLGIQDDMERALDHRPTEAVEGAWAEGIELIARKLQALLDSENLVALAEPGAQFDPNFHEAISHEPSDEYGNNEIIEVIQQGYKLGDRVVRPAQVRVAQ